MTRVALYARYSSDHQKDSSITDQFRNCEQRAAREGWTITARYEDKAISGATAERPGYQQMLTGRQGEAVRRAARGRLLAALPRQRRDGNAPAAAWSIGASASSA